jgi:hypothetical protein
MIQIRSPLLKKLALARDGCFLGIYLRNTPLGFYQPQGMVSFGLELLTTPVLGLVVAVIVLGS